MSLPQEFVRLRIRFLSTNFGGSTKKYSILAGGGSSRIYTALYLLDHSDPSTVIGIGRNPLRPELFLLNVDKRKNYRYHAYDLT